MNRAAVRVAKRVEVKKILNGLKPQNTADKLSPFGSDAFQKFYWSVECQYNVL